MELRHVVVATDQSEAGHHAVLVAARLAEQAGARLTVLSVHVAASAPTGPPSPPTEPEHDTLLRDLARGLRTDLQRVAPTMTPTFLVRAGVPGIEIPRYAEEHAGDLLVLGRKHRTQRQRMFLGDTADAVARRSQVPCLFVDAESNEFAPVLVCLDATERSVAVFQAAADFARTIDAPLRAVTVEPVWLNEPDELAATLPATRTLRLNRTLDRRLAATDLRIRRGSVLAELLAEADESETRLLVFGYHRGGPPGIVEGGSIARGLLHSARCAVLTVPL